VLLAQRANVDRYPPVLHQLRILAESGDVTVLDRMANVEREEVQAPAEVERLRIRFEAENGGRFSSLHHITDAFAFARTYNRLIAREPDIAISYDEDTAALLLHLSHGRPALKRVVHLHELPETTTAGRITRISMRYLLRSLNRADMVVLPDAHRAKVITEEFRLTQEPFVVMNCPALLPALPSSRLIPALCERGIVSSKVVHHQGSIGPAHYLDTIISSMKYWPSDAVFVMLGAGREEYFQRLRALAASIGVDERVIFLGRVPYGEVLSYAVGATLALTLLEPTIDNQRFSAGASNKRFEYAALGIPQVTNADPGMNKIFGDPGFAVLLEDVNPETIGSAVARILANPEAASEMGRRARAAHLSINNYEKQFEPVVSQFNSWLSDFT
jgi:hypothetical protein